MNLNLGSVRSTTPYNVLPIVILAAAIGWFLGSRNERVRGVTKQVAAASRGLLSWQGPSNNSANRGARRKVQTTEPMAGHGA